MFSAIVLAAGSSRRFGATKQLHLHDGKPLAQHAIDAAAASGADEVLVVIGHDAERVRTALRLPDNGRLVFNIDHAQGMSTSLSSGLLSMEPVSEAALIFLADHATPSAQAARSVVAGWDSSRMPVVRPRYQGGVLGHPVLLTATCIDDLVLLEGDEGARAFIDAHPDLVFEVDVDEAPPIDVDTPEDAERLVSGI